MVGFNNQFFLESHNLIVSILIPYYLCEVWPYGFTKKKSRTDFSSPVTVVLDLVFNPSQISSGLTNVRFVRFRKSSIHFPIEFGNTFGSFKTTVFPRCRLLSICIIIGISKFSAVFTSLYKYSQNLFFLFQQNLLFLDTKLSSMEFS